MSDDTTPATAREGRITREDLEARFRSVAGDVERTTEQARNMVVAGGAAVVVLLVVLAFLLGRRRGDRGSTVVEIRRI